ncbi:MAG TPA: 3-hydroxyacyl-CoA dehydrogenase NAD-binding domain-containing protein, partial [Candidatus Eisenbacteria bacterium]|nr:3-hydroxyacyl-CoA dehydrogenase NAD-binding domain-containing protein [Candidatus Eisenbacteria bacterium]
MRADDVKRVAVIGAGTMGNGIAHVFAQSGYAVTLVDVARDFLDRAIHTIEKNLRRQVEKGKIPEEAIRGTLSRIAIAAELETAAEAHLVVEAVTEDPETKFSLFRKLDEICPPESVFASNTSSISITEIGGATRRPDRVIGMHFMNPVPMMQLVEVVHGIGTSDETRALIMETSRRLGKTPVEVNDYPGFVSNRVLMPMINEAVYCVMENVAEPEAIDTVMKLGMNHPMGPLALADLIGLDTCLAIMEVLHQGFGDDKYRACPLLRK